MIENTAPQSAWARWAETMVGRPETSRACLADIARAADRSKPDERAIALDAEERLGSR